MTITREAYERQMGGGAKKATTTTPTASAPTFLTPPTTFPQYSSGSWANLPQGTWGAPQQMPAPALPPAIPGKPGKPGAQVQGGTYYPVNPLGPYSGPLGTAPPAPAAPTPSPGGGGAGLIGGNFQSILEMLLNRGRAGGGRYNGR